MMERLVLPKERCQSFATVVLCVLALCAGSLRAAGETAVSGATRHAVVSLQHITPEQGRNFLTRLNIATVSRMPGVNSLLVTGDEVELQKAAAVLELVDARIEFDARTLGPATPTMPSQAEIAAAVGSVAVGTFAHPPKDKNKMRAIVDVHNGNVVVIASTMQMQDIRYAVEIGPSVLRERRTVSSPAKAPSVSLSQATAMLEASVDGEPRFSMLPSELQEMRRRAAELRTQRQAESKAGSRPLSEGAGAMDDANSLDPAVPAGLQHVGAASDQNVPDKSLPETVAARPVAGDRGLQPGQTVPSEAGRITAPKIEPKSIMDGNGPLGLTPTASVSPVPSSLYEPAALPDGEDVITLNLPERVPVIDLLDLVGKHLNLSYLYDPQKVAGEVVWKLNGGLKGQVKKKDLYPLLEAALQDKDLVMTRHRGNIIRVMPKVEAQKADPELLLEGADPVLAGNAVVQKVFSLKHIDNSSADNLLQGMGLAIQVTPMAESRKMIVTAYAHRMGRIERLLELVDQPGAPRKFKYRQLRYTMAKTLADKVKALAEQLENVSVTIGVSEVVTENPAKLPGESDVAYRTRLATIRAAETARRANVAAAAARGATPQEPKPGVYLDADERTNRILMIGQEEQLTTVEELVDALDIAQQELRALQLYRIKYVDADEVARKLQELGIIRRVPEGGMSQRQSQTGSRITGQPAAAVARPGQPVVADGAASVTGTELTDEGLVGEPQVVVVESNNALLVNGTPEQHAKIAAIIGYVDSEMDLEEIPYKIYPLENSSPNHLAEILQNLIQESTEQQDKEGKIERVVTKRQEEIAIVPDPNTYSLIVYASKKNQEWIQSLIRQLDKRRPQVLIDVTLVEVTKTEAFNYDLNLIEMWPNLASSDAISSATGGAIKALTTPANLEAAGQDHLVGAASKGGKFNGYYADRHINALLTAMQTKNYGRVLAKPKILVNDNEPGKIKTADITYVKKTSSVPFTSSTAGQQNTSVQTSVDYDPYDAGIELNITPHISEGDLLRLDIQLTRSDFRPTEDNEAPPNTTKSEVTTGVTVPDGSTIILGGMVKLNQNKGGGKVPILGDIPLVGGLFRSINNSDIQSKLYVFVKAEVIRPEGAFAHGMKDLKELSDRNRMAFEKHELEFQKYQDWPGVKPRPVDPAKVLDTH